LNNIFHATVTMLNSNLPWKGQEQKGLQFKGDIRRWAKLPPGHPPSRREVLRSQGRQYHSTSSSGWEHGPDENQETAQVLPMFDPSTQKEGVCDRLTKWRWNEFSCHPQINLLLFVKEVQWIVKHYP